MISLSPDALHDILKTYRAQANVIPVEGGSAIRFFMPSLSCRNACHTPNGLEVIVRKRDNLPRSWAKCPVCSRVQS